MAGSLFPSLAVAIVVFWIVVLLTDNPYIASGSFILAFLIWFVGRSRSRKE